MSPHTYTLLVVIIVILASGKQQPQLKKQTQNPAPVQPCQDPQKFSKRMNVMELSQWLGNHPEIGTEHYQDDIDKLKGSYTSTAIIGRWYDFDLIF